MSVRKRGVQSRASGNRGLRTPVRHPEQKAHSRATVGRSSQYADAIHYRKTSSDSSVHLSKQHRATLLREGQEFSPEKPKASVTRRSTTLIKRRAAAPFLWLGRTVKTSLANVRQLLYRTKRGGYRRFIQKNFFPALGGLLLAVAAAPFMFMDAQAATAVLVPNSDVTSQWPVVQGGGGTHYGAVDEGITPDTNSYIGTGTGDQNGAGIQRFGMTTASNIDEATSITLNMHAQNFANTNNGRDDIVMRIYINDSVVATDTVTPPDGGAWTWYDLNITGSWNQSDIDSLEVSFEQIVQGGGPGANRQDNLRISTVYVDLEYEISLLTEQSSYQWFEDRDPEYKWENQCGCLWGASTMRSTSVASEDDVWLAGDGGQVWNYDGTEWSKADGTGRWGTNILRSVHAIDDSNVWVVGNSGHVWHYDGADWTQHSGSGRWGTNIINSVHANDPDNVWIAGGSQNIWHYDGADWNQIDIGTGSVGMLSVFALSETEVWFAGGMGLVYQYDGTSLTTHSSSGKWGSSVQINSVFAATSDNVWIAGTSGHVWHYNGTDWTQHSGASRWGTVNVNSIAVTGEAPAYTVWMSSNSGHVWRFSPFTGWVQKSGAGAWGSVNINSVSIVDSSTIWLAGDGGHVWYDDGSPTRHDGIAAGWGGMTAINSVSAVDDSNVWIAGNSGNVWHYDGADWTQHSGSGRWGTTNINSISANEDNVWIAGNSGNVWHYDVSTSTWTQHSGSSRWGTNTINSISIASFNSVMIGGASGHVWRYSGTTWTQESGSGAWGSTEIRSVSFRGTTDFWVAGVNGHVWQRPGPVPLEQHSGSGRWQTNIVTGIAQPPSGPSVWLIAQAGHVWHYDGSSWTQHSGSDRWEGDSMLSVSVIDEDNVWIAGQNGHVWHYDGLDWTQHSGLQKWSANQINEISASGDDNVWISGNSGHVWQYYYDYSPGPALNGVSQDTPTTAPPEGEPFRLRASISADQGDLPAESGNFKLQYAELGPDAVCTLDFSGGEEYRDVKMLPSEDTSLSSNPASASTEPVSPSTETWNNPENITDQSLGTLSEINLIDGGESSLLFAENFDFSIPDEATIEGIQVRAYGERNRQTFFLNFDAWVAENNHTVNLTHDGTSWSSSRSLTLPQTPSSADWAVAGGASNLWGEEWTASDINSDDFAVRITATHSHFEEGMTFNDSSFFGNMWDGIKEFFTPATAYAATAYSRIYDVEVVVHYSMPETEDVIFFYDNSEIPNGSGIVPSPDDPDPGSGSAVMQSYVESNNFTNPNTIPDGDYGIWDFALVDNDAPAEATYCFRIVNSDGSELDTYSVIPELRIPPPTYTQGDYRWFEQGVESKFSGRAGHTSVVFDNKIWVLGGADEFGLLNDVWSSPNGINWTQEVESAPWVARTNHASVVYDGKIWVTGGNAGGFSDSLNDVWYSSDGVNWSQSGNFSGQGAEGHSLTVFDGKMVLTGGIEVPGFCFGCDYSTHTWIRTSTDGISWTNESGNIPARQYNQIVTEGGTLYSIAGAHEDVDNGSPSTTRFNTTHSSSNLSSWSNLGSATWNARERHGGAAFDSKIWILGGEDGSSRYNDIYSSGDGVSWTLETASADWSARSEHTTVVFDSKLWVIGGRGDGGSLYNGVWSSSDGSTWVEVSPDQSQGGGVEVDSPLAPQNQGTEIGANDAARLRMLIDVDDKDATEGDFKLQYAPRLGDVCSTDFTGFNYQDVNHIGFSGDELDTGLIPGANVYQDDSNEGEPWGAFGTNIQDVLVDNTDGPMVSLGAAQVSQYLVVDSFDFDIPPDVTIQGIEATYRLPSTEGANYYLVKGGDYISPGGTTPIVTDGDYTIVGDDSSLWGEEWSPAEFNDPDFGLALTFLNDGGGSGGVAHYMALTVYYKIEGDGGVSEEEAGNVAYFNSEGASTGLSFDPSVDDPTSSRDIVNQVYVQSNNFSIVNATPRGATAMFDFSIYDNSESGGNYCFRVVKADGSLLDNYAFIPELGTPPRQQQFMRHGRWFDTAEQARPFFW